VKTIDKPLETLKKTFEGLIDKLCHEVREKISGIIHTFKDKA